MGNDPYWFFQICLVFRLENCAAAVCIHVAGIGIVDLEFVHLKNGYFRFFEKRNFNQKSGIANFTQKGGRLSSSFLLISREALAIPLAKSRGFTATSGNKAAFKEKKV